MNDISAFPVIGCVFDSKKFLEAQNLSRHHAMSFPLLFLSDELRIIYCIPDLDVDVMRILNSEIPAGFMISHRK